MHLKYVLVEITSYFKSYLKLRKDGLQLSKNR